MTPPTQAQLIIDEPGKPSRAVRCEIENGYIRCLEPITPTTAMTFTLAAAAQVVELDIAKDPEA